MKRIHTHTLLRWAKRLLVYFAGIFFIALGIALSARSGLGVSPVGSPANVLYQIGLDMGLPEHVFNLGNWTIVFYSLYILFQILALGRRFRPIQFLQIAVSVVFGWFVNLASAAIAGLPAPVTYLGRLAYLAPSIPLISLGVMTYLCPGLLPTPGEGVTLTLQERWNIPLPKGKTIFDCSVVGISAVLSLLYFHGLVGVREGTIISALTVGAVMKLMQKLFQKPLLRFVER